MKSSSILILLILIIHTETTGCDNEKNCKIKLNQPSRNYIYMYIKHRESEREMNTQYSWFSGMLIENSQ